MLNIDETIDAFRRGALDLDCKRMVLRQRKENGEHFEGPGQIRQSPDGTLTFKIYVTQHNAKPFGHLKALSSTRAGAFHTDAAFYDLDAIGHDDTRWTATRNLIAPNWNMTDMSVLLSARPRSITARLKMPQGRHYLRLHFFEEYDIPLREVSETEVHGATYLVRDRALFEACGSQFEVRKRNELGDTVIETTSDKAFPTAYNLRIQEALQYITGKPAIWRARLESAEDELHLELASPRRNSPRTQFSPPLSPASIHFHDDGWGLFAKYLAYVITNTEDTYWNPVAYHLNNACEATANSVDSWAIGVSVAVEALASLIGTEEDKAKAEAITIFQDRIRIWLAKQVDLPSDLVRRASAQIDAMTNKRPQDILYSLAANGHVEKAYIKAWSNLRNRHVHPKLKDLKKPSPEDDQRLLDNIHRTEVLLRQMTFHLIKYEGHFTDYGTLGAHDFPTKQYPLSSP